MKNSILYWLLLSLLALSCNTKGDSPTEENKGSNPQKTIEVHRNINKDVFWGDTHLHTTNSPDAFSFGARLTPDDANRFAKGEKIHINGSDIQLERPLDFLVVADHAEGIGLITEIMKENKALMQEPLLQKWAKNLQVGGEKASETGRELIDLFSSGNLPKILTERKVMGPIMFKIWNDYLSVTDRHNTPGKFTSFIGYEWSSLPQGNNLHRVVVYRDGMEKAKTSLPISSSLSSDPEDLWKGLQQYEDKSKGKVLAIPHNGNLSNGLMFALADYHGNPMTKEYASIRSRWEPIVETTQIKGDSESHPFLSPNDEHAGYGISGWDLANLNMSIAKKKEMLQYEYSREALKNGLLLESQLGVNPFKFGMIGSTDSHTALATADRDNYSGKFAWMTNNNTRASNTVGLGNHTVDGVKRYTWQYLASGYAAVWAESNTREDIWDAMNRKEVYGTTGPRIKLRFFGGWDYQTADLESADFASIGYEKGVPMGGTMIQTLNRKSPSFMIAASRDPLGANLDRVQVIKGWTSEGKTFEKIYDVKWSGNRIIGQDGKLPAVGNTVNPDKASFENSIGAPELVTVWQDPDFDASINAFYYVRVLEIPTPRWTTYDAARNDLELLKEIPKSVQERAYSSPIWYTSNRD